MNVSQLIDILKDMPQSANVYCLWDGKSRTSVEVAYLSRGEHVVLSDLDEVVYEDNDRPNYAPSELQEPRWKINLPPLV